MDREGGYGGGQMWMCQRRGREASVKRRRAERKGRWM